MIKPPVKRLIYEPIGSKDNGAATRIRAHVSNLLGEDPTLNEAWLSIDHYLNTTSISSNSLFAKFYDQRNTSPQVLEVFHIPTDTVVVRLRLNPLHPETKGGKP